ncbi:hypothetical protein CDIMF43_200372 [Carnobacterium divergens]|nr:hypothetical protein CDIMF43_200372 [Carnobacterium divergens]
MHLFKTTNTTILLVNYSHEL